MTVADANPQLATRPRGNWLVLGAASAGVGAALLGFSLLGPQTGVAAADGAGETSVSAGPSTTDRAETSRPTAAQRRAERRATRTETRQARRADRTVDAEPASADRDVQASATVSSTATPTATPTATVTTAVTSTRRTLFNSAPTVTPVQLTGQVDGPITGTVGASDPEGDPLTYRIRRAPREGSVQLADDGTYTYTPNGQFDGVDTFRVAVLDGSPFRPWGTSATSLINQGAITFQFRYTDGGTTWTAQRQQALQDVARELTGYIMVTQPVTLTYNVGVETNPGNLASAGSALTSGYAGFWRTVVQNKLLSGVDSNGSAADGQINWNFSYAWGLDDTIGADEYDFTSTALHELLHSFGFLSEIDKAGSNTGRSWTSFDRFVVAADGHKPISAFYTWNTADNARLTGASGGLFFGGANAVAAYGGLVPLYTPNPWESGSSMSHLDDTTFTGADDQVMNAKAGKGPGVRVLSAVELGILKDLGYQVVTPQNSALAFVGLLVLVRRRRRAGSSVGEDAA
ncbi:Ig-like domain-containing protein [Mycolicibacterium psychrotolerans]|uniref:Peptidase n=1 Tax=Mycolicibacterium psychrotolerans TaxID=216929 RepID=A0A7I7M6C0_9MYCO|nr:Ig-like domain-containing protein [Mycolicibacterium psychrotolerans]BBX67427.1 hypothetical protein MPSYJ_08880 [Mycolicibacterium psychrotolerans]